MGEIASNIFTGKNSLQSLSQFLASNSFSQIFVLVDENTQKHCYPLVNALLPEHKVIRIKSRERNKTLQTCEAIWEKLTDANADRVALLINLGGGVIGDLGGFAAGCYKRGIKFINLPTTLLAMVDASVGAKTGIDFMGFKNQIGLFNDPAAVFIHSNFLKTLADRELLAGFAEVIKHYLIADKDAFNEIGKLLAPKTAIADKIRKMDLDALVEKNVLIKSKIVSKDKFETGERKALNFGHTIGHALETYFLKHGGDVLHGEAVAIGIICEGWISLQNKAIQRSEYLAILQLIGAVFPELPAFKKQSIPAILRLIGQDKKSADAKNQFTLLQGIGNFSINNFVEESLIIQSLQYYSELSA
jgi:3-dehydroquinate synthase